MEWVNQLKMKLKGFIHERAFELGLPHLSSNQSQLLNVYMNSKDPEGRRAQPGEQMDQETSDRLAQMQKTLVLL